MVADGDFIVVDSGFDGGWWWFTCGWWWIACGWWRLASLPRPEIGLHLSSFILFFVYWHPEIVIWRPEDSMLASVVDAILRRYRFRWSCGRWNKLRRLELAATGWCAVVVVWELIRVALRREILRSLLLSWTNIQYVKELIVSYLQLILFFGIIFWDYSLVVFFSGVYESLRLVSPIIFWLFTSCLFFRRSWVATLSFTDFVFRANWNSILRCDFIL